MKKWALSISLLFLSSGIIHAEGVTAYHKLRAGETLWFLAQVYYGNGNDYIRIMTANHLPNAEAIHEGDELEIPDPHWLQTMPKFGSRYLKLAHHRDVALLEKRNKRAIASESPASVVEPADK